MDYNKITFVLCNQVTDGGGSGKCRTIHVKLIVDPASIYKSGPPAIVVIGSAHTNVQVRELRMRKILNKPIDIL